MEVRVGGRPLPRLRSRKGLWLLALLALRGSLAVERRWLAGTLWPDCDDAASRHSLRQTLCDLRAALGEEAWRLSSNSPRTLWLDTSDAMIDVFAFDAAIERGGPDSLEEAVRLYRGPLLEDCAEDWCVEERRRREQDYVSALEGLAADAAGRNDYPAATGFLRQATAVDAFREDLQRALMQALASGDDAAGTLQVYRDFRTLLWNEMSAAPSEATNALYRQLREKARKPSRPTPASTIERPEPESASSVGSAVRNLRVPLTELIGREEAVQEILFLLSRSRLVTLMGAGGVGKTRLALKVAEDVAEEFDDGACFVDLSSLADPELVPAAVRDSLDVPRGDSRQESLAALSHYLARRRLLLVLDNCEHLLPACASLADALLGNAPGLRILATSRHALGLRGETIWRVPSLALPPELTHEHARARSAPTPSPATFPAVQLFVERARASEPSFEITFQNATSIVEICRRLDGIPLAIELAAARVRSLSAGEISARLQNGFSLLTSGGSNALPRQQTLEAAFRWSWDLLSGSEKSMLARLSVFAGGWSLQAAEAICAGDGVRPESILDLLTSLVDKSLVLYAPSGAGRSPGIGANVLGRYRSLETARQFAAERLDESGERESVMNRHSDHFLSWARDIQPLKSGADEAAWFDRLEVEHDNLRAAIDWCRAAGNLEQEFRIVGVMSRFWGTRGYLREEQAHLESVLARATPDLNRRLHANACGKAGWSALQMGDYTTACRHFSQALMLFRELGAEPETAATLNYLACATANAGDLPSARHLFEESLTMQRELGSPGGLASVLNNYGETLLRFGESSAGRGYIGESISLCKVTEGTWQLHGIALGNLATIELRAGRHVDAQENCSGALRMLRDCGAFVDTPSALDQMGVIAQALGEPVRAARLLGAADGLGEAYGVEKVEVLAEERTIATASARLALGIDAFDVAFEEGRTMSLDQAVAYALGESASG